MIEEDDVSVTPEQVRSALAKVMSPRGQPLTEAGVLSEIVIHDGKVFFSINVDASDAKAWETVRAQADAAVKALPGIASAASTLIEKNTLPSAALIALSTLAWVSATPRGDLTLVRLSRTCCCVTLKAHLLELRMPH